MFFVPLRFVGEQLGLNVVWDKETKTVALTEKAQAPKKLLQYNIQAKIKVIVLHCQEKTGVKNILI